MSVENNAQYDDNKNPSLTGVSSADGTTIITLHADPVTHRLLTSAASFTDQETPSGSINGSNVTFTLAAAPNPENSLMLFLNGLLMTEGGTEDFTISSLTITMAIAPPSGSNFRCWYRT